MEESSIIILNYHQISDDSRDAFSIKTSAFFGHLWLMREMGIPVLPLNGMARPVPGKFAIALTFDDGYETHYDRVAPLLESFKYPASFFPIVNRVGAAGRMDWKQLRALAEDGFGIGSHGLSHIAFPAFSHEGLQRELAVSKKTIEENIQQKVTDLALPFGWYNKYILDLAMQEGYNRAHATGLKRVRNGASPFLYHRWNITNKTTGALRDILLSKGELPLGLRISGTFKGFVKQLLGYEVTSGINKLFRYE